MSEWARLVVPPCALIIRGTLVSTRAAPGRMNFDVSNLLLEFLSGLRQLIEEALGW